MPSSVEKHLTDFTQTPQPLSVREYHPYFTYEQSNNEVLICQRSHS